MAGSALKVWLVRDLEPLPIDVNGPRPRRSSIIAKYLAASGIDTRWITSNFCHATKSLRQPVRHDLKIAENLEISALPGPGYQHNIGLRRVYHNHIFADQFKKYFLASPERPDVLLTDVPTIETADITTQLGKQFNIPTVLTIRDLWPDFFNDHLPSPLKVFGAGFVKIQDRRVKRACANASHLVGISESYLTWALQKADRPRRLSDRIFPLSYLPLNPSTPSERQTLLKKLGVPADKKLVVYIGSYGATYDLKLLYEIATSFVNQVDVCFVFAGARGVAGNVIQQLEMLPNTKLLPMLNSGELVDLCEEVAIGLAPYKPDAPQGLPNKFFEYMANGVFQISTLSGEAKSVLERTGTGVVCSGDPDSFRHHILANLDGSKQRKLKIKQVFKENFDPEQIYSDLVEHIKSIGQNRLC